MPGPEAAGDWGGGAGGAVVRRAPFSDNPVVGARGQRTQQRILDGALRAFGEEGYHRCSIDSITRRAGCSRVSFYQYFSGKEDVFGHLAAQVSRQMEASTDRLDPVSATAGGWAALREWAARDAEIHDRYRAVFHAFPAGGDGDSVLGHGSPATHRYVRAIRSRLVEPTLPNRTIDAVIELSRQCLGRTLDDVSMLRSMAGDAFRGPDILDAYTDVVHRTFFGLLPDINVHGHRGPRPSRVDFGPVMRSLLDEHGAFGAAVRQGGPSFGALLQAARGVFVDRGFDGTRVDDIVEAAGVSHGAFYRYFKNKDELAHLLAADAMRTISATLVEIPDLTGDGRSGRAALRRWLQDYNRAQAGETAMIRVWVDAARHDHSLVADSAAVIDWGRRRMARFLRPRGFGDVDLDALVMVALVDAFGVRERPARTVEAAVQIIQRGFLGR
jgi:AcrR family transcriptional regulator